MSGLGALRRLTTPPPAAPEPDERCEFCAVDIGERHGHIADIVDHRLLCVCRPCYLLFAPQGAGGGRYRGVGEDVRRVEDVALTDVAWDALRIPVDLAFLFMQTGADNVLAFYPGPGGATESLLDLAAWHGIVDANPVLASMVPDVEAVLLRRTADGFACYVVPVDLCYELVGVVRLHWTGLGGGTEVWQAIAGFFSELDARAVAVPRQGAA